MFISPFTKTICPYCFEKFHISECPVKSGISDATIAKPSGEIKHRFLRRSLKEYQNEHHLVRLQCPNTNCGQSLPDFISDFKQRFIALLGAQNSGKSTYIASLIAQLTGNRNNFLQELGWQVTAATKKTAETYQQKFWEPLLVRKEALPPTAPGSTDQNTREPLIYELIGPRLSRFKRRPISHILLFDSAGENLQDENQMAFQNRYISSSHGLIFFLDPFEFESLNSEIKKVNDSIETIKPERSPMTVLRNSISQIYRDRGLTAGSKLDIPAAIVFSKFDIILYEKLGLTNFNSNFSSDSLVFRLPSHSEGFDESHINSASRDMKKAVENWGGSAFNNYVTSVFPRHCYFGVSSTGEPKNHQNKYREINPYQVLEPVYWLLYQWKIIPSKKYN